MEISSRGKENPFMKIITMNTNSQFGLMKEVLQSPHGTKRRQRGILMKQKKEKEEMKEEESQKEKVLENKEEDKVTKEHKKKEKKKGFGEKFKKKVQKASKATQDFVSKIGASEKTRSK